VRASETTYQRHQNHRATIPAAEVEAFVALLAVDPQPSALGRPRTPGGALRTVLMTIVEHLAYALAYGLGVAGAGVLFIELLALVLELIGVEPAFGWALTAYLIFAAALMILGGVGRVLFAPDPSDSAARLVAGAKTQKYPSSREDLGAARGRLRSARARRRGAAWLAALLRQIPELPAMEVAWRSAHRGSWTFSGLKGSEGEVQLSLDGSGALEATHRSTHARVSLTGPPDDPAQVAARDTILGWLDVDGAQAPREPADLRSTRMVFWTALTLWLVVWGAAVVGGSLAVAERLPSQWAALAGYVLAASVAVPLMGLRSHLAYRHPGLRGPVLTPEERAAEIYESAEADAAVKG
jgi:hypothetical protein